MCNKKPLNVFMFRNAQTLIDRRVKYSVIRVYLMELWRQAHEIQVRILSSFDCNDRVRFVQLHPASE